MLTKLKLKLKSRVEKRKNRTRYNVEFLKNKERMETFRLTLSNKYEILQDLLGEENIEVNPHWECLKKTWTSTCEEVLGKKKRQHTDWISVETINKLQVRKEKKAVLNNSRTRSTKAAAHEQYTVANRAVKKSVKTDKVNCIDNLAKEAEDAAARGNMKHLYDTTRKLAGKFKHAEIPIKDKNGVILTSEEDPMGRWRDHFEELLNRPAPSYQPDIPLASEVLEVNCERSDREEIRKAISLLKTSKAIKADMETSTEMLYDLIGKIWDTDEIPIGWKEGYLVKIPKKGDLQECKNYRGIMLLSVLGKVINRIILERLKNEVDNILRDYQAGFRQDRGCIDQIATLRIIVEQSMEFDSYLYINFVDYEKAFDSLDRDTLWKLLQHYGKPEKIITLIRNTYDGMTCKVTRAGRLTDSFQVKTGVRPGCLQSPFMSLVAIDVIMKTTTKNRSNGIQWTSWTIWILPMTWPFYHTVMNRENRSAKPSLSADRT